MPLVALRAAYAATTVTVPRPAASLFLSDQFAGFHAIVVPGTLRDSLYILVGLLASGGSRTVLRRESRRGSPAGDLGSSSAVGRAGTGTACFQQGRLSPTSRHLLTRLQEER